VLPLAVPPSVDPALVVDANGVALDAHGAGRSAICGGVGGGNPGSVRPPGMLGCRSVCERSKPGASKA
jgi:hypothetical protein